MLEGIFWFSLLFIFYAYAGYPLLLKFISFFKERPVQKGAIIPDTSLIITAYNEEKRIGAKLRNTLNLIYPKEKLEIIVASDCSNDKTDEIVQSYHAQGVKLVRSPERRGKENAQKYAVDEAKGEILVFTDVATILEPNGILNIVKNFNDSKIGCVSSVDRFIDQDGKISGEGFYVKYEMFLRELETKVNSLVGLSGSFFAARREVCHPWAVHLQSDFNTLLNCIRKGLRGVSDQGSVGIYLNISNPKKEFDRKVRTILRGISVFMKNGSVLNIFKYGLFSWQLFSHKLCRWLVPFFLILIFMSNFILMFHSNIYKGVFFLQIIFYLMAIDWSIKERLLFNRILKIPFYFVMVNLSILIAWYRYFKGQRFMAWEPSQR